MHAQHVRVVDARARGDLALGIGDAVTPVERQHLDGELLCARARMHTPTCAHAARNRRRHAPSLAAAATRARTLASLFSRRAENTSPFWPLPMQTHSSRGARKSSHETAAAAPPPSPPASAHMLTQTETAERTQSAQQEKNAHGLAERMGALAARKATSAQSRVPDPDAASSAHARTTTQPKRRCKSWKARYWRAWPLLSHLFVTRRAETARRQLECISHRVARPCGCPPPSHTHTHLIPPPP